MVLEFTQILTERIPANISGDEARMAHKAHNLTAICEPTV
jgi:hypothetical protein